MNRRSSLTVIALLLLFVTSTGCMGDDDDNATPDVAASPVTAQSVLEGASQSWSELTSTHFDLQVDGEAFLDNEETLKLQSAQGDLKRPDSVAALAKLIAGPFPVDVSITAVGGEIFMTNLLTGNWEAAPADFSYDPSVLFSETEGIGPILTKLQSPTLADGTEDVDGRKARLVTGTVDAGTVSKITAGAIQGESIKVSLWIDEQSSQLLKVQLTEPEGIREQPATWVLLLTEHNKDVTIEKPQV